MVCKNEIGSDDDDTDEEHDNLKIDTNVVKSSNHKTIAPALSQGSPKSDDDGIKFEEVDSESLICYYND